jgi:hypothetical protein
VLFVAYTANQKRPLDRLQRMHIFSAQQTLEQSAAKVRFPPNLTVVAMLKAGEPNLKSGLVSG